MSKDVQTTAVEEPYKVPFTYAGPPTRQLATAPDGAALLIVSCNGPAILLEDGVQVGDFPTMEVARMFAQLRYHNRAQKRGPDAAGNPLHHFQIQWTTVS